MQEFSYKGLHECDCVCDMEIEHLDNGMILVMVSESPKNTGTSVTNAAELLFKQVVESFELKEETVVWVEHYPPVEGMQAESYDLVRLWARQFLSGDLDVMGAKWKHITSEEAMFLLMGEYPFVDRDWICNANIE